MILDLVDVQENVSITIPEVFELNRTASTCSLRIQGSKQALLDSSVFTLV